MAITTAGLQPDLKQVYVVHPVHFMFRMSPWKKHNRCSCNLSKMGTCTFITMGIDNTLMHNPGPATHHWVLPQPESCEKQSQHGIVYECRQSFLRWPWNMHVHSYLQSCIHTWALQHIVSSSWCSILMLHGSSASKRDKYLPLWHKQIREASHAYFRQSCICHQLMLNTLYFPLF